jgi:predicted XRE-type DNA-binding protein
MFEEGSGNIFVDTGFSEADAVNISARLELMMQIENTIKERGWTQQQAAQALGISQSRVSELMTSHSEKFTIDKLMKLLCKLGKEVTQKTADKDLNIARTAYAELKRNETKNS